mgnify:CR=1 FL=1
MVLEDREFIQGFLMHRVELKDQWIVSAIQDYYEKVPNAPCGVESPTVSKRSLPLPPFLMHRVELKGLNEFATYSAIPLFLMHRVELKDLGRRQGI